MDDLYASSYVNGICISVVDVWYSKVGGRMNRIVTQVFDGREAIVHNGNIFTIYQQ